mgnify:CR=1 FL=1
MDANEYLAQIHEAKGRISALKVRKRAYEGMADSIPTHPLDEPKTQKSRTNPQAPFVRWMDRILEAGKAIDEAEAELKRLTDEAMGIIRRMESPEHQGILVRRYFDEMSWDDICLELSISRSTCWRWHREALREFGKTMKDETR